MKSSLEEVPSPPIEMLFEDDDLLVINKPAGLRVIRDGYHPELPTVSSTLEAHFGRVFVVHRLDKDTSGVLILARSAFSHKNLNSQFVDRQVKKQYHAVVISLEDFPPMLVVDQPLLVDGDRRHRTRVDFVRGKSACTEFSLITQFSHEALVKAFPTTGYTHQIREHALYAGYPLLGDSLYAFPVKGDRQYTYRVNFNRPALHAFTIRFYHPRTLLPLEFTAEYPPEFANLLTLLKQ